MKKIHNRSIISIIVIAYTIAIFLFLYRNLDIGSMWSFSDLLPFDAQKRMDLFFGTWDSNMLGYPFISSSTPSVLLLFSMLITNDIIVQNTYYLSFIPLSFVTMYFLSKQLISSTTGRYFSSFLYALNPITIGEFYNGSVWMNIYVLSPLIILFTIKFLESKDLDFSYGLIISIMIGLIYSTMWIVVWTILFPVILITLIKLIHELRIKNHIFLKRSVYLFFFILLGLALLLPSIDYVLFTKEKAFSEESVQSFFGDIRNNYRDATPANILRMAGNAGSPMDLFGYDKNSWWTIFGYVITIFMIYSILDSKFMKDSYYVSFLIIILITVIFMSLTYLQWTYGIFENFSFLFSLRNPKYIMYSFSLASSLLFGLGIHKFAANSIDPEKKYLALFIILISLTIYSYPVWGGDMGLRNKVTYTVPYYYSNTFDYLKNDTEYYRVLWLPYTYSMQTRLANSIDHIGVKLGQNLFLSPSYKNIENLFLSIENNRTKNFAQKIGFFNVKYVIIDKNFIPEKQREFSRNFSDNIGIHYAYKAPFIHGSPEKFIGYINSIDGLEKIYENGNIIIYKNNYFVPYIFISNTSQRQEIIEKNLINNSDFSNTTDYWRLWNVKGGIISVPGQYMNVINPDKKNSIIITQGFNTTAGNKYEFSINMNSSSNYTHAKIAWYDQFKNLSEEKVISHSVVKEFIYEDGEKKYKETFISPKNAVFGVVFLVAGKTMTDQPAYSNFTNISVVEIDPDKSIMSFNKSDILPVENYDKNIGRLSFNIETNENKTLVLLESYNENWKAYIGDKELKHFEILNWANGFQIQGEEDGIVRIEYGPQKNRNNIILAWITGWIFVLALVVLMVYKKLKRS